MDNLADLVKAANSVEFAIWTHMERIRAGYTQLTNAQTAGDAKDALKNLKLSAADMERAIRDILYKWNCPVALVLDVNNQAAKMWRFDALSGLFANLSHYHLRFTHARGETEQDKMAAKVRELTSVYYLVKDLAECSLEIDPERYRNDHV